MQRRSTCSAAPRKCQSRSTSPSPSRSRSDPEGVGPSLSEGGERSGEGATLNARPLRWAVAASGYAALNHIAVSKALLISGMFMPKLLFAAVLAAALTGLSLPLTLLRSGGHFRRPLP